MKRAAIVYMILLLAVLSCQVFTPESASQGGGNEQPTAVDPAVYFLPDPAIGLDSLQSYTQSLSISFTGTREGKPVEFTNNYNQTVNGPTKTRFTYVAITDVEGAQTQIVAGNAGEAYYSKSGDEKCHVSWGSRAQGVEPFLPTTFLPPLQGAHEAGSEQLNEIQTTRYTFDATSLGYPADTKVDGQVWLAVDGGYIVKYSLHIQDEGAIFGEGMQGEQVYEYELNEINTVRGPELPEGCPAVLVDFPAMPDALDIMRLPQTLAYTSPSDSSQVSSFYKQQLQDLGWTRSSTHSYLENGNTLVFLHEGESKIAFITLEGAGTNTWVIVKVEPIGETIPGMLP